MHFILQPSIRYDYEGCETAPAEQMMTNLNNLIDTCSLVGKEYSHGDKAFKVAKMDNFEYTDPIDHSVSKKQVRYPAPYDLPTSNSNLII